MPTQVFRSDLSAIKEVVEKSVGHKNGKCELGGCCISWMDQEHIIGETVTMGIVGDDLNLVDEIET